MQNFESCIIKMNEITVLLRMIDDTFVCDHVGFSDNEDGTQLQLSLNLLIEKFGSNLEALRESYYGGTV